jgi:hypothetical protein
MVTHFPRIDQHAPHPQSRCVFGEVPVASPGDPVAAACAVATRTIIDIAQYIR